tara:strand:- start:3515 stop:5434 length:1920 start_codon:yes stop_codon:yes gene_type:complete
MSGPVAAKDSGFKKPFKLIPIKKLQEQGFISETDLKSLVSQNVSFALAEFRQEIEGLRQGDTVEFGGLDDDLYLWNFESTEPVLMKDLAEKTGATEVTLRALGLSPQEIQQEIVREPKNWQSLKEEVASFNGATRNLNLGELRLMQDSAVHKRFRDPHATSIVENIATYTIGQGLVFKAASPVVQSHLTQFMKDNDMSLNMLDIVKECYTEGELFNALFTNKRTGKVRRRTIPTSEIMQVSTHSEDSATPLGYHRMKSLFSSSGNQEDDAWWPDIGYFDQKEEDWGEDFSELDFGEEQAILHMKYGTDIRGRLPLEPVLKWLKMVEVWITDRARLNHTRAKVVWIKTVKNRSGESIASYQPPPKGGITLVATENVKWEILESKIAAGDAKEDGLSLLYMVGAGVCVPIHILSQRADEQVYASIKKADTPFSNMIAAQQNFYEFYMDKLFRWVLRMGSKYGDLPDTVKVPQFTADIQKEAMSQLTKSVVYEGKNIDEAIEEMFSFFKEAEEDGAMEDVEVPIEEVEVTFTFPDMVREDPLVQARRIFLLHKTGLFSNTYLGSLEGTDYIEQQYRRRTEPEPFNPPDQAQGFPGGSSSDGSGQPSTDPGSSDGPGTSKGTTPDRDSATEEACQTCGAPAEV